MNYTITTPNNGPGERQRAWPSPTRSANSLTFVSASPGCSTRPARSAAPSDRWTTAPTTSRTITVTVAPGASGRIPNSRDRHAHQFDPEHVEQQRRRPCARHPAADRQPAERPRAPAARSRRPRTSTPAAVPARDALGQCRRGRLRARQLRRLLPLRQRRPRRRADAPEHRVPQRPAEARRPPGRDLGRGRRHSRASTPASRRSQTIRGASSPRTTRPTSPRWARSRPTGSSTSPRAIRRRPRTRPATTTGTTRTTWSRASRGRPRCERQPDAPYACEYKGVDAARHPARTSAAATTTSSSRTCPTRQASWTVNAWVKPDFYNEAHGIFEHIQTLWVTADNRFACKPLNAADNTIESAPYSQADLQKWHHRHLRARGRHACGSTSTASRSTRVTGVPNQFAGGAHQGFIGFANQSEAPTGQGPDRQRQLPPQRADGRADQLPVADRRHPRRQVRPERGGRRRRRAARREDRRARGPRPVLARVDEASRWSRSPAATRSTAATLDPDFVVTYTQHPRRPGLLGQPGQRPDADAAARTRRPCSRSRPRTRWADLNAGTTPHLLHARRGPRLPRPDRVRARARRRSPAATRRSPTTASRTRRTRTS